MYAFLDKFFFVFHSTLIVFILFGWVWKKTRRANLAAILATAFCWTVLGIWYGFGYCPCTDWHWQVRAKLGFYDMHPSYVGFLMESLTGWEVDRRLADIPAVGLLVVSFIGSVVTNVRDWLRRP